MALASGVKQIDYKSELHKKLLDAINWRYQFSRDRMSTFYTKWSDAEDMSRAYMTPTENDVQRQNQRKTAGVPQYTTIVVPYSYAMLMSAHTYWSTVFLSRSPIFQYQGRHGESDLQCQAIESLIDYQVLVGRWLAPLYVWLKDCGMYGLGVMFGFWDEEFETVSRIIEVPREVMGIQIPGTKHKVRQTVKIAGYEGNKLFNVRPQDYFPDPRVPAWDVQSMEFVGRIYDVGWTTLKKKEREGRYYNLQHAWALAQRDINREPGSSQLTLPYDYLQASGYMLDEHDKGFQECLEMGIELIPSDWGLGKGNEPEKWMFTVLNKAVIVSAQPLGYFHNRWPVFVLPYEVDGYQVAGRGMLEIGQPLNDTITWLVNAHFYNVRKALNDQFVVDPSMVEMVDVLDPGPGRLWRLKPAAYGMDTSKVYSQMQSVDITQQNVKDSELVGVLMQKVLGVMENTMGTLAPGGRKTATEVRTASGSSANRQKTQAEWMSATGWSSLAQIMLQTTQQMYTTAKKHRIAGDIGVPAREIGPDEIQGFFDFIPVDGTLPVDRFALATLWKEIIKELMTLPQLAMNYDINRIFEYAAQLGGLKSIKQFRVKVMPDEQVMGQSQAGNIIPIGGSNDRSSSGSSTTIAPDAPGAGGIPSTPQISRLGKIG